MPNSNYDEFNLTSGETSPQDDKSRKGGAKKKAARINAAKELRKKNKWITCGNCG